MAKKDKTAAIEAMEASPPAPEAAPSPEPAPDKAEEAPVEATPAAPPEPQPPQVYKVAETAHGSWYGSMQVFHAGMLVSERTHGKEGMEKLRALGVKLIPVP